MKPIFIVLCVGVIAALVGLFLLGRLMSPSDSELAAVTDLNLRCPVTFVSNRSDQPVSRNDVTWKVSVSNNGENTAPKVRLDRREVPGMPEGQKVCTLAIKEPPREPYDGIDWRIGHKIEDIGELAGKTVKITVRLSGDRDISVPTGSAYSYDGSNVRATAIGTVPREPADFSWQHDLPGDADYLEIWLRLALHGGIEPAGEIYIADTVVEELPN